MTDVLERTIRPPHAVDLRLTLAPLRRGGADPSMRVGPSGIWRATWTPCGPATTRLWETRTDGEIHVQAWGPGAEWAFEAAPALVGAEDDDDGFERVASRHVTVAAIWRRLSSVRFCRSQAVTEALVPTILEQKVVGLDARQSYCRIVRAYGEPAPEAPGGPRLLLPPSAKRLSGLPGWAFHRFNVERKRADTVRIACRVAHRLDECAGLGPEIAHRRLRALPGIGAWSSAEAVRLSLGDPDAVSVGDYHLPHLVTYSLAGEPRGTDERMLELLEPWRGQRARVVRMLELGGSFPPRRGPRMPRQSIAAI